MITIKDLANTLPHLHRMLLQLQYYNLTIKYKPGCEILLTGALSWCPARTSLEINVDVQVDYIVFNKAWIK